MARTNDDGTEYASTSRHGEVGAKPGKQQPKPLADIAAELGYTPGEFTLTRINENTKRVGEWIYELRRGLVPDDLADAGFGSVAECWPMVIEESKALERQELEWVVFFHSRKHHTQLTGADDEPLIPDLTDTERAARLGSLLDAARARGAGLAADGRSDVAPDGGAADGGFEE